MKHILILAFMGVMALTSYAQTKRGDKLVGVSFGSFSMTSSDSKTTYSNTPTVYNSDGSSFSVSVNPNVAWFIQDNLAIGGSFSMGYYSSKSNGSNTSSTTTSESKSTQPSFYIGPLARYYFGGSEKGMPFAQVNYQYGVYVVATVQAAAVKPLPSLKVIGMQDLHWVMSILQLLILAYMLQLASITANLKLPMSIDLQQEQVTTIPANTVDFIFLLMLVSKCTYCQKIKGIESVNDFKSYL